MTRMWRKSAGVGSPLAVRAVLLTLWRTPLWDWLQSLPLHLSPQVSPGQSERQKRPIRGQSESPPPPQVLLIP